MIEIIRHTLVAIAYRYRKAVSNCKEDYHAFNAGKGVRTPIEILRHMRGVIYYAIHMLSGAERYPVEEGSWKEENAAFIEALKELDAHISSSTVSEELLKRVMQGPLADVLTHIGQLAMLNRLNDRPVSGENFSKADLETGKID